jgi:hypothetical protein
MQITHGGASAVATKPVIWLEGGIHAREWIAPAAVLYMAYSLVTLAATPTVASMLNQYVFVIIAPLNADGYAFTWDSVRYWRKTRSNRMKCGTAPDGVAGVDPNRNWGFTRDMISKVPGGEQLGDLVNPCLDTYEGPAVESEPEVKAVADWLRSRQTKSFQTRSGTTPGAGYVAAFIDYHSYCMFILPPWGYSALWPAAPDSAYMKALGDSMATAIRNTTGRIFGVGPDLLPADPGTAPDWTYGALGIRASMTLELEGHETNSTFCLPANRIKSVGKEQFQALGALVQHLRTQGDQPSVQFGMFAGSPAAPPIGPAAKWMVTKHVWSERLRRYSSAPIIACMAFATALGLFGVTTWRRRLAINNHPVQFCEEEEGIE